MSCRGEDGELAECALKLDLTDRDWAQVSSEGEHTCAIKTDGRLFCWGAGGSGRLGNDSTSGSLVPVQEDSAATDRTQVTAGYAHTCAIKQDGRLFCWGGGRLGNDPISGSLVPVQEDSAATDWMQVSAGYAHTCALKQDGRLFTCHSQNPRRLG